MGTFRFMVLSEGNVTGMRHIRKHIFGIRTFRDLPPITSRAKKETETEGTEGFFVTRKEIEAMMKDPSRYIVTKTKNNLTAIDTARMIDILKRPNEDGLMVVSPEMGAEISRHPAVKGNDRIATVLLSHVSLSMATALMWHGGNQALEKHLTSILGSRMVWVAARSKIRMTDAQLSRSVKRDVSSALTALSYAREFKYVVPSPWSVNESWTQTFPTGPAAETMLAIIGIMKGTEKAAEYSKPEDWPPILPG